MAKTTKVSHLHIALLSLSALLLSATFLMNSINRSKAINLQSNKEVAKKQCEAQGEPVINITQRVLNTVDSGEGGNNWAFDTLNRQIKVYQNTDNTYCVLADYEGKFDSQANELSPGKNGNLTGSEDGTFKGGYRASI